MKIKSVTVAKIERDIYALIESGLKTLEVRDERIETPTVCFVDSETGEYLGAYLIRDIAEISLSHEYPHRDTWFEMLSFICSIPMQKAHELFDGALLHESTLYVHKLGEKLDIMDELFPRFEEEGK